VTVHPHRPPPGGPRGQTGAAVLRLDDGTSMVANSVERCWTGSLLLASPRRRCGSPRPLPVGDGAQGRHDAVVARAVVGGPGDAAGFGECGSLGAVAASMGAEPDSDDRQDGDGHGRRCAEHFDAHDRAGGGDVGRSREHGDESNGHPRHRQAPGATEGRSEHRANREQRVAATPITPTRPAGEAESRTRCQTHHVLP
jgi:hypothetical protein